MAMYQFAGDPKGPWLGVLGGEEYFDSPHKALEYARATFEYPKVFIAEVRPLRPEDVLLPTELVVSESIERAMAQYGPNTGDRVVSMREELVMAYESAFIYLSQLLEQNPIMTPIRTVPYSAGAMVRPGDFAEAGIVYVAEEKKKPRLEDLL